ncbi:MAG: 4Fe-4S binding protein [Nitrososphaerota archaeon]|nr:4Fe-4S binding protein [Nitrososphaerota archaeon]
MPWIVKVDEDKCTGEGECVTVCPVSVFELQGKKAKVVRGEDCVGCMACISVCPSNAITVTEY